LLQTSSRNFGDLSQDEIYKKFIDQEKKKQWKTLKSLVVKDVVDKYGIMTGTGKYASVINTSPRKQISNQNI
jgi:hypothetical protein